MTLTVRMGGGGEGGRGDMHYFSLYSSDVAAKYIGLRMKLDLF